MVVFVLANSRHFLHIFAIFFNIFKFATCLMTNAVRFDGLAYTNPFIKKIVVYFSF